jgi:hypothetical protein
VTQRSLDGETVQGHGNVGIIEILATPRPLLTAPRDTYIYYQDTGEVPESQAVKCAQPRDDVP